MMRQRTIKEQLAYGIANDHLSGREEGFKHWMQFYRTLSVEAVARVEALEEHLRVLAKSLHSGDDAPQALEDSIYEMLAPPPAVATVSRIIRQDDAAYDALSESQKRRARLGGMTIEVPRSEG